MTTKEFIEKAIEGGWKYDNQLHELTENGDFIIQTVLLDTKAWEAVGKVVLEELNMMNELVNTIYTNERYSEKHFKEYANEMMHAMIDHLVEGGNVESYLKNL